MSEATDDQAAPQTFEHIEQVGTVELDRYCSNCGYNLRQQAIRRETSTKLLLCKCPECGTFEPANTLTTAHRSWFRQLAVLFWLLWVAVWLGLIAGSVSSVTGLAVVSGEVRRNWVDMEDVDRGVIFANRGLENYQNNSGYYTNSVWTLRPMDEDEIAIIALLLSISAAIGAVMTTITLVAMPHWPRWGYACFAFGWPMIVVLVFHGLFWREEYDWRRVAGDYMNWHLWMGIAVEAVAIAGGLLAVWLGRPAARWLVRLIVAPKRRGVFAYLWLVDGKAPPKTTG